MITALLKFFALSFLGILFCVALLPLILPLLPFIAIFALLAWAANSYEKSIKKGQ